MTRWIWLSMLGAMSVGCSNLNATGSRMGKVYPALAEGCPVRFENLSMEEASASLERLGLVTLTGTTDQPATWEGETQAKLAPKVCEMGGTIVTPNAAIGGTSTLGMGSGMIQFVVWREKPQASQEAPKNASAPALSWQGCTKRVAGSLRIVCPDFSVSLGKVLRPTEPTDQELRAAEREVLDTSLRQLLGKTEASPQVRSEVLNIDGESLTHTAAQVPETAKTHPMHLRSLAMAVNDEGRHAIVVYSCVAKADGSCAAAFTDLLARGLPQLEAAP